MSLTAIERRIAQFDPASPPAPAASEATAFAQLTRGGVPAAEPVAVDEESPMPTVDRALISRTAASNGVDPALVLAVIQNESGFNSHATSPAGAMGLMQLMPDTARSLGVNDPYDPAQNVAGGTAYLRTLLDRFNGNTALAVAAYNAGPGAVEQNGGIPPYPETQRYVGAVLSTVNRWRTANA